MMNREISLKRSLLAKNHKITNEIASGLDIGIDTGIDIGIEQLVILELFH